MNSEITIRTDTRFNYKTALRLVMGLVLLFTGLNGLFNLIPMPAPSQSGLEFLEAIGQTKYLFPIIKVLETVVGFALLFNRYVPLALIVIFPISLNIILFHLFLDLKGIALGLVVFLLNLALTWFHREIYEPLFVRGHKI